MNTDVQSGYGPPSTPVNKLLDDQLIERLRNAAFPGDNDYMISQYLTRAATRIGELRAQLVAAGIIPTD